jgi:hypothetical protein
MKLQSHTNNALLEQPDIQQVWTPKNHSDFKNLAHYVTLRFVSCNEAASSKTIV